MRKKYWLKIRHVFMAIATLGSFSYGGAVVLANVPMLESPSVMGERHSTENSWKSKMFFHPTWGFSMVYLVPKSEILVVSDSMGIPLADSPDESCDIVAISGGTTERILALWDGISPQKRYAACVIWIGTAELNRGGDALRVGENIAIAARRAATLADQVVVVHPNHRTTVRVEGISLVDTRPYLQETCSDRIHATYSNLRKMFSDYCQLSL